MLAYENEAIVAQQGGQDIDYVVPDQTILIENPAAVTPRAAMPPTAAKAFLDFLYTTDAQQAFANTGYRPVVEGVTPTEWNHLPDPSRPVHDRLILAAGTTVTTKFFDKTNGIVARHRARTGYQPMTVATPAAGSGTGRSSRIRGRGVGLGPGIAAAYLGLIVLIPIAAVAFKAFADGHWRLRRRGHGPSVGRGNQADLHAGAHRRRDQRGDGHDHRLDARARRLPGQELSQLADRPAVRAADDRRRA